MDKMTKEPKLLILVAGAKGAIGTTLAMAATAVKKDPEKVLGYLTTQKEALTPFMARDIEIAGWDRSTISLEKSIQKHGILPEDQWRKFSEDLNKIVIIDPPSPKIPFISQVEQIRRDIKLFRETNDDAEVVMVNLLPAGMMHDLSSVNSLDELFSHKDATILPDLAYVLAAVMAGVPVANFTPNEVEIPAVVQTAVKNNVPISGRDGKTGQTYLKMVLASALKARHLYVDGWYSLNILGNADGLNLMNPDNAAGKLVNKTDVLDEILGYPVGEHYNGLSHKVHIDYYPPRGDAKEAWDVIDFTGLFGMPMSLRLNLQGRDSILAAPMVLDLARWMAALHRIGKKGLIPELAFYYKKSAGAVNLFTFQEQLAALVRLEKEICL